SSALSSTAPEDWNTMRWTPASFAALRNAGAKPGTAASKNTAETSLKAADRLCRSDRSPETTSAPAGRLALAGSRVSAHILAGGHELLDDRSAHGCGCCSYQDHSVHPFLL